MTSTQRAAKLAIAAGIAIGLTFTVSMPASATTVRWVQASDILSTRAVTGTSWFADISGAGTFADGTFLGDQALVLHDALSADGVRILYTYGTGATQPSIADATSGSYTYGGVNVNYQVEILYTPADPANYGPTGTTPCTHPALPTTFCYTTLKWEPLVTSPSAWTNVQLDPTAPLTATTGGWISTNRVGVYAKPGPLLGQTIAQYEAQMAGAPIILGIGASIGTGSVNFTGYVKTISFPGSSADSNFNFGVAPPPAPALAATGVDAMPIVGVGVTLIGMGLLAAFLRRRRTV